MTKETHYWLYNAGLLETLTFCHEEKVYWFLSLNSNRFVYSNYFIGDALPGFLKIAGLI